MTKTAKKELPATDIVTDPVRIAFPSLYHARKFEDADRATYQATLLLPDDMDLKPFYACLKAAMVKKFDGVVKIKKGKNPIRDCEEKEEIDGYDEGWHFINASSGYAPEVIDQQKRRITDETKIFAGCWCRFHLSAWAWSNKKGGKGVSFSINSVQLVREDDRIDGRAAATDMYDEIQVEGDDDVFDNADESGDDERDDLFG